MFVVPGGGNLSTDSYVRRQKRFQAALRKIQRFTESLWAWTLSLGGVMKEGRCCDHGNFPRKCLSGSRLSWPKLAKARSGLVPTFHERRNWLFPLGYTTVQGCWMLPRNPGSLRQGVFCCCSPLTCWHLKSSTYRLGCGDVGIALGASRERGSL